MAVPGLTGALMAIAPSSAPTTSSSTTITTSTSASTTITTSSNTGSSSVTTSSSISTTTPLITTSNVPFNVLPLNTRNRDQPIQSDTITMTGSEARATSKPYRTTLTALTTTKMASLMPDTQTQGLDSGSGLASSSGSGKSRLAMLFEIIDPKGKGRTTRGGDGVDSRRERGTGAGGGGDGSLEGGSSGEVTVDCMGEPLADAFLVEPIPYRSAVNDGATHVIVLRTRPDPCRYVINTTYQYNLLTQAIKPITKSSKPRY